MTCSCNDTGRVLAERNKGTVEAACARCTTARLAAIEAGIEAGNAHMDRMLTEAEARLAAVRERVEAIAKRIEERRKAGAS